MTTPTTNYTVSGQDLSGIFLPIGSSAVGPLTNMTFYNSTTLSYVDLSTVFMPLSSNMRTLPSATNFNAPKTTGGTAVDLNAFFAANNPFTVSFTVTPAAPYTPYTSFYNSGYYTVVFANYTGVSTQPIGRSAVAASITFTQSVKNFQFTLIGGGGGGGGSASGTSGTSGWSGGGGGSGGQSYQSSSTTTISANTKYEIQVGGGGAGGTKSPTNGSSGDTSTITVNSTMNSAAGGLGGKLAVGSGGAGTSGVNGAGSGGRGGTYNNSIASTPGTESTYTVTILGQPYYYGGGGSGGSFQKETGGILGGLGGGGAAAFGTGGNAGQAYGGPNGISYAAGSSPSYGWPSTGGGGAGGNGNNGRPGGQGGGGIVVLTFQYP